MPLAEVDFISAPTRAFACRSSGCELLKAASELWDRLLCYSVCEPRGLRAVMPDSRYDVIIVGGGIVGLAVALEITRRLPRLRLLLLEKEVGVARHQSGHNSGVIHSGIYYKPGSLKAKLCVEGARAMVEFCREHRIPNLVCGKVIVATYEKELAGLEELRRRGESNGLTGVRVIGAEELREIEPHARGLRALVVPSTGITDYAAVCRKYAGLVSAQGGTILTSTAVTGIKRGADQIVVEVAAAAEEDAEKVEPHTSAAEAIAEADGLDAARKRCSTQTRGFSGSSKAGDGSFSAAFLINCAGLFSDRVCRMAGDDPQVMIVPFRGEYYDLIPARAGLVRALIYPVPDPRFPFLGVHFTRRVGGRVDAGPNAVLALRREGYRRSDFSLRDLASSTAFLGFWRMAAKHWRSGLEEFQRSFSKGAFVRALQRLVPEVCPEDLVPGGSGVRAQALRRDGTLVDDFQIVPSRRMLHVLNVPSPAATASLVIGRTIVNMAEEELGLGKG
jgi:L-2-hydroxyglutarate oxidase LhgO